MLAFEVPGKITRMEVKEGDYVEKGQVIAALDQREYKAEFDAAQAENKNAEHEFNTSKRLLEQGAIARTKFPSDQRRYEIAQARLRKATKSLADSELRALYTGIIGKKLVDDFGNVAAKEPVYSGRR